MIIYFNCSAFWTICYMTIISFQAFTFNTKLTIRFSMLV